jgi:hypothetical protein
MGNEYWPKAWCLYSFTVNALFILADELWDKHLLLVFVKVVTLCELGFSSPTFRAFEA